MDSSMTGIDLLTSLKVLYCSVCAGSHYNLLIRHCFASFIIICHLPSEYRTPTLGL